MGFSVWPSQRRTGIPFKCHLPFYVAGIILASDKRLELTRRTTLKKYLGEKLKSVPMAERKMFSDEEKIPKVCRIIHDCSIVTSLFTWDFTILAFF